MTGARTDQAAIVFLSQSTETINKFGSGVQPQVQYGYSTGVHNGGLLGLDIQTVAQGC